MFSNAKYIKAVPAPTEFSLYDPLPVFRRSFYVEGSIKEAKIFVQSPGFAKYYINGEEITEDLFISPVSDYRQILWYNEYDVSKYLKKGENTVCVIASNGFLNESFASAWPFATVEWRDAPQFMLSLWINGENILVSDGSWKASLDRSPIIFSHLRSGEYYDARKSDSSYMLSGYDDSLWDNALESSSFDASKLRAVTCPPVREVEKIAPVSIEKNEKGLVVDFGETISGYIEIELSSVRGNEIKFYYAEQLNSDKTPKHNNMDDKYFYKESPFMMDKLIASGGLDRFKPSFAYHGFRYVVIEGLYELPKNLCACFVHQDVKRTSRFESGNEIINYIYKAGIRSTYSNMFWSITDCPTREKLGWTNDAQASLEQTLINFDIASLYEKWFEDVKSSMQADGSLPGIIPSPDWGFSCGPICDCLLYELPYRVYLYTGNEKMLTSAIPYFERYIDYLEKRLNSGKAFALGDWMGGSNSKLIPKEFVAEFYLVKAIKITALAHTLAKNTAFAKAWEERLDKAKQIFRDKYIDESGMCKIAEQSAVAMAIHLEVSNDQEAICDQLVEIVLRDNLVLSCGMVGVQYLYRALSEANRADLAYKMITESEPGYKTWYRAGATTLWERFDGENNGSHNHHMYSGVISWFFSSLLGISPKEETPAFEKIDLKPNFIKEMGYVIGEMDTVRGRIKASWRFENGKFLYSVSIPEGTTAYFGENLLSPGENNFLVDIEEDHNIIKISGEKI